MLGGLSTLDRELDTICAVSSPNGEGAISVIRASGRSAGDILRKIFKPYIKGAAVDAAAVLFQPRRVYTGKLLDPDSGSFVDEVNAVFFKSPKTFTGEDIIEIYPHGGVFNTRYILEIVLRSGARLAYNGEFSKRAFLNGKIDLIQAEAILGIIKANSLHNLLIANNQLGGLLKNRIEGIRDDLLYLLAAVEALIDFPEEEFVDVEEKFHFKSEALLKKLSSLLNSYSDFSKFDGGPSVVIAGKPNAGKSSLMNALLQKKRAIVSDIPGTTRDYIEESLFIFNKRIKIVDTAGLRHGEDSVETEGIRMSFEQIEEAHIVVYVIDGSSENPDGFSYPSGQLKEKDVVFVLNKLDLLGPDNSESLSGKFSFLINSLYKDYGKNEIARVIPVSAAKGSGIDDLKSVLHDKVLKIESVSSEGTAITTLRQKSLVEKSMLALEDAVGKFKNSSPLEIVALDLRQAAGCLDEIAGAVTGEEVLDTLFKEFCIGK